MSFFDRFFGKKIPLPAQPDVLFGRYTDAYKTPEQTAALEAAMRKFDSGEAFAAWKLFFKYLTDPQARNVRFWENEPGKIGFELIQGSQKVVGSLTENRVEAEAKIAKADTTNVGLMRRLVEDNRLLRHTRFALDPENHLSILFRSDALDASPLKLLSALKELATQADKHDDLLLGEFKMLRSTDATLQKPIPDAEKRVKIEFLRSEILRTFERMDAASLRPEQNAGAQAYLLLQLIYRLDYLVRPEGFTTETLERIHRTYFENDGKNKFQKIQAARRELQKILDRTDDELAAELYRTTATFGITRQVDHEKIVSFIDGELPSMNFLLDSGQAELSLAIPGYVVGYSLFNYAMPQPDRALFFLYLQISEPVFFQKLGFSLSFWENGQLSKKAILTAIASIVEENRGSFSRLRPAIGQLRFDNLAVFAQSFLMMVRGLDLN